MSYSIGARGATKALALAALAAKFDAKVLVHQPVHAVDREVHLAHMERQLALYPEPSEGQEVALSLNGYLSWQNGEDEKVFMSGGFGGGVSIVRQEPPKA